VLALAILVGGFFVVSAVEGYRLWSERQRHEKHFRDWTLSSDAGLETKQPRLMRDRSCFESTDGARRVLSHPHSAEVSQWKQ
jgi:hypothetical protein